MAVVHPIDVNKTGNDHFPIVPKSLPTVIPESLATPELGLLPISLQLVLKQLNSDIVFFYPVSASPTTDPYHRSSLISVAQNSNTVFTQQTALADLFLSAVCSVKGQDLKLNWLPVRKLILGPLNHRIKMSHSRSKTNTEANVEIQL